MSSNLDECRLLITKPAGGAWNMAVDEVLLGEVARTGTPMLRLYSWQRPTLSLGYFQPAQDRSQHPASQSVDLVRRLSGGGAILHDRELTYSLILPKTHLLARNSQLLYRRVHQAIVSTLNSLLAEAHSTWQASLCELPVGGSPLDEPFLCFQRRTSGDILLRERNATRATPAHKVVGSAQRRRRGTVLQHGSILVRQSERAPELVGFADHLPAQLPSPTDLQPLLVQALPQRLGFQPKELTWNAQLAAASDELERSKYLAHSWTERR
jgi:lipoate-protein ligase A